MKKKKIVIEQFLKLMPSNKIFGLEIISLTSEELLLRIPFKEEFIGDFVERRWHGGFLASIADSAGGIMGASTFNSHEERISTINMHVDYLHRTYDEALFAKAKLVKSGKRIVTVEVDLYHESKEVNTSARISYSTLRK